MPVRIYHNPRCSKSRQTLKLIEEAGVQPEIVLYLETPPDEDELLDLINMLDIRAHELLRTQEDEYSRAGLSPDSSEQEIIAAMVKYPKLIERPIVVKDGKAVLGRPPENVNKLLS